MFQHFRSHGAFLDHRAIFGQVTLQHGNAAGSAHRFLVGVDHFRTKDPGTLDVFAHGLAGDGHAIFFNEAVFGQFVHDGTDTPGFLDINHVEGAAGAQLGQVRSLLADLIEQFQGQVHTGFMGDGRQVQGRVGGTPHGHIHSDGIVEGFFRHDVSGTDVLFQHFHDLFAGCFGQGDPGALIGGRDGAVARQAHAQDFCQGVHGIGREQAGTGAAARAGTVFDLGQFFLVDLACCETAGSFEHSADTDVFAMVPAGEHGPAADHHSGDVQPGSSHEHAGDDLVAVGNQHQGVESVAVGNGFDAVSHQFPAGQGIFHAIVAHGDAVTDADGREFNGSTTVFQHAVFHGLGNSIQIHMPRDNFVLGVANPDQGFLQFVFRIPHCIEQGTMGRAGRTFFHNRTSHTIPLFFF